MTATLTVTSSPDVAPDATLYVVDCAHATTKALHIPSVGVEDLSPAQWSLAVVVQHEWRERCGCVAALYARYAAPMSVAPAGP